MADDTTDPAITAILDWIESNGVGQQRATHLGAGPSSVQTRWFTFVHRSLDDSTTDSTG